MDFLQQKSLIEALIFTATEPITLKELRSVTEMTEADIVRAVNELKEEYNSRQGGLMLVEVAEGYQIVTRPDFALWIRKLKKTAQSSKLSQAALETLAIIAYKQPLTKIDVDQIRGVNSEGAVKSLLDKRLIKIVGKKEAPGRPFLYGTTRDFLQYFGLKSLTDLPPLNDVFKEDAA